MTKQENESTFECQHGLKEYESAVCEKCNDKEDCAIYEKEKK